MGTAEFRRGRPRAREAMGVYGQLKIANFEDRALVRASSLLISSNVVWSKPVSIRTARRDDCVSLRAARTLAAEARAEFMFANEPGFRENVEQFPRPFKKLSKYLEFRTLSKLF